MTDLAQYRAFLEAKVPAAPSQGLAVDPAAINPILKPHQRAMVQWGVAGGRRAYCASFGLGKTIVQLETLRIILDQVGGRGLIVAPLGVRQEFMRDAALLGIDLRFIRSIEEAGASGIYLTNYETVRDGKLDPNNFAAASLDEANVLRGFGGVKTFREFRRLFARVRYRFVATATPSPNSFIEMLAYSAFLDVMDVSTAKTRWFKRNSEKADELTLHAHKTHEFWMWVATWALFLQRPSDLGFSDEGYDLPEIEICWHEVPTDHRTAGETRDGQALMFKNAAVGVSQAAREKRTSLDARIAKMMEIRAAEPDEHRIIWHDLEDERRAIEAAIPGVVSVYGSQDLDEREAAIMGFSNGEHAELAAKPVMLGSGTNLQRHCCRAIYLGIGFKFDQLIQSLHRLQRFLQPRAVRIDLIYTEAEREIRRSLQEKWRRHDEQAAVMSAIIREYGMAHAAMAAVLTRSMDVERVERAGETWRMVNNDCVAEVASMPEVSVDLILTSIPFGQMYSYCPSYRDFGHTDNNAHFWQQMDFLIPELLRVTKPGRVAAIHVKDRIVPGGMTGLGFQTVYRFSDDCCDAFERHGWAFLARKTVCTDVVRENNQTYRLGWTEQCKDGTKMGAGLPEYVLLFRRPPSDLSNGYADVPVMKEKPLATDDEGTVRPFNSRNNWKRPVPGTGYSRGQWQLDAHGSFTRSSGERLLSSSELLNLPHDQLYKLWRDRSTDQVYDAAAHVAICEQLDEMQRLPATFMLLPPHSWHPDVWTDITRMRTLNGAQSAAGREMHLCPLQLDLVDRLIVQLSMKGETVFDPFAGIGTVPSQAVRLGRRGLGVELSPDYFADAAFYCAAAEQEMSVPTLFDLLGEQEAA